MESGEGCGDEDQSKMEEDIDIVSITTICFPSLYISHHILYIYISIIRIKYKKKYIIISYLYIYSLY